MPDFRGLPNIHDEILSEVSTKDDEEGEGIDIEFCPTDALLRKPVLFSSWKLMIWLEICICQSSMLSY